MGERIRLARELPACRAVVRVHASAANFLLVEFHDAEAAFRAIAAAGLLVRDFRTQAGLDRALRITVGTPQQNDRLIGSLK